MSACRRCSECIGSDHHFLQPEHDPETGESCMPCKHCDFEAPVCESCLGPIYPMPAEGGVFCEQCRDEEDMQESLQLSDGTDPE